MFLSQAARACLAALVAALLPQWVWAQSAIPFKQENAAGGSDISRVILALLLCVLVLAAVLFVLRKYLPGMARPQSGGQRLQVLETRRLGPRTALHVVQFGGQQYLIGDSEHGLVNLARAEAIIETTIEATIETKIETNMESPDAQP